MQQNRWSYSHRRAVGSNASGFGSGSGAGLLSPVLSEVSEIGSDNVTDGNRHSGVSQTRQSYTGFNTYAPS